MYICHRIGTNEVAKSKQALLIVLIVKHVLIVHLINCDESLVMWIFSHKISLVSWRKIQNWILIKIIKYNIKIKFYNIKLPKNGNVSQKHYQEIIANNIFMNFKIVLLNHKFTRAPIFSFYWNISLYWSIS